MKTESDSKQIILVTAKGYNISFALVRTIEKNSNGNWEQYLDIAGFIGENDFTNNKVEGDCKTPIWHSTEKMTDHIHSYG